MATGGGTEAVISPPLSPYRDHSPGLVGRLLHRTTRARSSNQRHYNRRSTGSAVPSATDPTFFPTGAEKRLSDPAAGSCSWQVAEPAPQQRTGAALNAGDNALPQPHWSNAGEKPASAASPAAGDMPSATPQPQLKKKASFRDRLKAWQKAPPPLEAVSEESKPRFVYEPTHAASDFSRLAVSPLSPSRRRRRPPPVDYPLAGYGRPPTPPTDHDDVSDAPRQGEDPSARHGPRCRAPRHSYALGEDPFEASTAAVHIPVSSRPVAWTLGVPTAARTDEEQRASQPLSDYELFIARAEAEDRARRERILRSISQRSAAYATSRVKPDPHRQFVSVASSSSADTTAQKPNSGGRYVLASSNGVERRRQQQQQQQRQQQEQQQPAIIPGRGHTRHSSWTPSYSTGGSGSQLQQQPQPQPWNQHPQERRQPRRPSEPASSPPQPQPQPQSIPIVYGVDEGLNRARDYQPQPPRMLRRQASLTQRIVDYIRPAKPAAAVVRPVETLVE